MLVGLQYCCEVYSHDTVGQVQSKMWRSWSVLGFTSRVAGISLYSDLYSLTKFYPLGHETSAYILVNSVG